jgi:hypothetical protein
LVALEIVTPLTVTVIGPLVAPDGTRVVILVEVDPVTTASVPLNSTTLFDGIVLKLVPLMVTVAVSAPLVGLNPEIVGVGRTVKIAAFVTVTPLTVTDMGPVVAPDGTVVVILVGDEAETIV